MKAPVWSLEDLVDFEEEIASSPAVTPEIRAAVQEAARGMEGAAARRTGLRVWLEMEGRTSAGARFGAGLSMVGAGFSLVMFGVGISAVAGLLDPKRGGLNVTLFLAILIGGQWLLLLMAAVAWLFRRRAAAGFSGVQALAGMLARRLAGSGNATWWRGLTAGGGAPRAAVLWRLALLAQVAGVFFNFGILCGLAGVVMVKHVGFFWETTTEAAMRSFLETAVAILSAPWASWWPGAVPDAAVIDVSRWLPGEDGKLAPGPAEWWQFLLAATFVWGLAPRALLGIIAWKSGRSALAAMDFQSRAHRALWREITGHERPESGDPPLDGVLVLDVGGSGLTSDSLRPFLLRRLRVHPAAWYPVAVLDAGAEEEVARALAKAPAGVVLLAEGWALSPARMTALHTRIRSSARAGIPLKFLVANVDPAGNPAAPSADERREWERFVDALRDPAAEVFFFTN